MPDPRNWKGNADYIQRIYCNFVGQLDAINEKVPIALILASGMFPERWGIAEQRQKLSII